MQVSQVDDHVTHAIIGGGAAIQATISQDASFFHMLSATLYSDQPLAVVREVMCNAWDAHIESGRKDKPIEITLSGNTLTFKDFGKGIHRDDIGFIYLNYGGSTKKNDGNQTGGFGLGCKAPWAYVDHFEVTSCHAGVKSIYRMIKSCPEAEGKPSAKPVGSFKTDDTGLTVTIQLKNSSDAQKFDQLIKRIAFNGDIPVMYNGHLLPTVKFDSEKVNFILRHKDQMPNSNSGASICIRYGNVVYPAHATPEWQTEHNRLMNHLSKFNGSYPSGWRSFQIMFQAPPHSITVTPSREMLSMQGQTIETLKKLVKDYLQKYDEPLASRSIQFIDESINKAVENKDYPALITRQNRPASTISSEKAFVELTTVDAMAELALISSYPDTQQFRKADLSKRIRLMVKAGMLNRGLAHTFLTSLDADSKHNDQWLTKRVLAPLVLKLQQKKMPVSLMVYDEDDLAVDHWKNYNAGYQPLVLATKSRQKSTLNAYPYLRNIVVVTHIQKNLKERLKPHPVFQKFGWHHGFLVYTTSTKKKDKEDALAFFNASGMVVVDMTVRQSWEPEFDRILAERKVKPDGLIQLSNIIGVGSSVNTNYIKQDNVTRMSKPEFILSVSLARGESHNSIAGFTTDMLKRVVKFFGNRGAVTNMGATFDKCIRDGAKPFHQWISDLICDTMMTNPNVQKYYASSMRESDVETFVPPAARDTVAACFSEPKLAREYGIWADLTEEERFIVEMWDEGYLKHLHSASAADPVIAHLKTIPQTKEVMEFYKKVTNNNLVSLIDSVVLVGAVSSTNAARSAEAIGFIKSIIK